MNKAKFKKIYPSPYAYPGMVDMAAVMSVSLIKPEEVVERVCRYFGLTQTEIMSRTRVRRICMPRQIAMYYMRTELGMGCVAVGKFFNLDHTTIVHAQRTMEGLLDVDCKYRNILLEIKHDTKMVIGKWKEAEKQKPVSAEEPKVKESRPDATYSNNGFIAVTKKYAS